MTTKMVLLPISPVHINVRVHPVALFSICDAFIRRSERQERVIGTLLGTVGENNTYEIKSCFVVPHSDAENQVTVDTGHYQTMLALHQRVAPSEVMLGWFATGSTVYSSDTMLQEFFSGQPGHLTQIHLKVDTTLAGKQFSVMAYQSRVLGFKERPLSTEFIEIPCEVLFADIERAGVELLSAGPAPQPLADSEGLAASLLRLESLMDHVYALVDDVVEGRRVGDPAVGRFIADTLAVVPRFNKAHFERLFNENVQDTLMITYLSNLVRTQIALAEKLGTNQLPIL